MLNISAKTEGEKVTKFRKYPDWNSPSIGGVLPKNDNVRLTISSFGGRRLRFPARR